MRFSRLSIPYHCLWSEYTGRNRRRVGRSSSSLSSGCDNALGRSSISIVSASNCTVVPRNFDLPGVCVTGDVFCSWVVSSLPSSSSVVRDEEAIGGKMGLIGDMRAVGLDGDSDFLFLVGVSS